MTDDTNVNGTGASQWDSKTLSGRRVLRSCLNAGVDVVDQMSRAGARAVT